jgi:hypothetical protein
MQKLFCGLILNFVNCASLLCESFEANNFNLMGRNYKKIAQNLKLTFLVKILP